MLSPSSGKALRNPNPISMGNGKGGDIEAGVVGGALYPNMTESPQLRWVFIRKVYSIVTLQLLVTAAVAASVTFVRPIPAFFLSATPAAVAVYFLLALILPMLTLVPLAIYRERHPLNLLLLGLFTVCISFAIGISCALTNGKVIVEAVSVSFAVVVSLTVYTFWAARRGHDFNFLGPFLFTALLVLILYGLIQIFIPMGKIMTTIYGFLATILFAGFIIYDTDNLIKRHSYDEYVPAAISLYLDVINLFMALMTLFNAAAAD